MADSYQVIKRHWEFYTTPAGASPVREYLHSLPKPARAAIGAQMHRIETGQAVGKKLRNDIFEVKVAVGGMAYRILYATVGERGATLLAVEGFTKKTRKTPPETIDLAETRLREWRARHVRE